MNSITKMKAIYRLTKERDILDNSNIEGLTKSEINKLNEEVDNYSFAISLIKESLKQDPGSYSVYVDKNDGICKALDLVGIDYIYIMTNLGLAIILNEKASIINAVKETIDNNKEWIKAACHSGREAFYQTSKNLDEINLGEIFINPKTKDLILRVEWWAFNRNCMLSYNLTTNKKGRKPTKVNPIYELHNGNHDNHIHWNLCK